MEAPVDDQRRNFIRFNPDSMETALVDPDENRFLAYHAQNYTFTPSIVALIYDQSYSGCSIIVINYKQENSFLPIGLQCVIKVGEMSPLQGKVRWRETLTNDVLKIGIEFF